MTGDRRWEQLQALHEAALALEGDAREQLLLAAERDDPVLAREVRTMLRIPNARIAVLERGIADAAASLLARETEHALPAAIGPYRAVRLLGEGGMGVVYLVERTDVGGLAALKMLRDSWLGPSRRERFRMEQRTLARLRHPGIAQLYDAGMLADGTPWFAMEYVEGEPITGYANRVGLDVDQRLALARGVIDAVQFAHGHAIIHRDLKPSNMLVTADGTVKLLDFGIAKQVDDSGAPGDATATAQRMLTPAYAAPEQFHGGPVGVHTDVFALGVILYELVTGHRPFSAADRERSGPDDVRRHEAVRPSVVVRSGPHPRGRVAWAELDVIVRKAMHPEPDRRYRTADALRRDIDHYLGNEPLEARPDSVSYRATRFARRNWRGVALATAAMAALVVGSIAYTVRVARARDLAMSEAQRTARMQQFMLSLFAGGDEAAGPADTLRVRTLIDRGIREAAALDAEPEAQADLYLALGGLQHQLGRLESAETLFRRSVAQQERLHGVTGPQVVPALTALARLQVDRADLAGAEQTLVGALAIADRQLAPSDARAIDAHAAMGRLKQENGAYADAIAEQEVVLARLGPTARLERAAALVELAGSHFYAGHLEQSDSLNRLALALYVALRGPAHPLVADVVINLGAAEFERGRYAEAEVHYRDAVERLRSWHGENHPATASGLTMLGRSLNFQKKDSAAVVVLQQALAVQERVHGPVHPAVASALNDLANIDLRNDRLDDAERQWKRTEAIYVSIHGELHWLTGIARSNLGSVRMARKDFRGAEGFFRNAAAIFASSQGPGHVNTGIAHIKLGRSLLRQDRFRDAVSETERGYRILTALPEAPKGFIDAARTDLAAGYGQLGDRAKAAEFKGP